MLKLDVLPCGWGSHLLELLLIGPSMLLGGPGWWRLSAPRRGHARWDCGHPKHRAVLRSHTETHDRGLSKVETVQFEVFVVRRLLCSLSLIRVFYITSRVRTWRIRIFVRSADLQTWERNSGQWVGNFSCQNVVHRGLVAVESPHTSVYVGFHKGVDLRLRQVELLLQSQTRCLLALQVLHDRLELRTGAAVLGTLHAGEPASRGRLRSASVATHWLKFPCKMR